MKQLQYNDLINFITNFIEFEDNEEEIKEKHPEFEDADDFEDIFSIEIRKDSYKELFSNFLNWNPTLLKYLNCKGEADYSRVYYVYINFFDKNSEERLVAQSSYLHINSNSDSIDPGYCNQICEEIASKGRLDVVHTVTQDFLDMMAGHDYSYLHFLITEHLENVDPAFPERKTMILEADYYNSEYVPDDDEPNFEEE
jgi:hypothetical protein